MVDWITGDIFPPDVADILIQNSSVDDSTDCDEICDVNFEDSMVEDCEFDNILDVVFDNDEFD